eukprot:jgi/Bigna1/134354/aug1.24_g9062
MAFEDDVLTIFVIYTLALVPIPLLIIQFTFRPGLRWISAVYGYSVFLCAVGWEIWWTFGILNGDPVNVRRESKTLNKFIPQSINWLVNSLADGTVTLLGILLLSLYRAKPLAKFSLIDFFVLYIWFNFQDILASALLFANQLDTGTLSLAPFAPFHVTWNPVAMIGPVAVNIELPWLISPFFWYPGALYLRRLYSVHSIQLRGNDVRVSGSQGKREQFDNLTEYIALTQYV